MTRIWIIRHGNTFEPGETPRRIGARTDLPLVESGRGQALALARWFARQGVRFDRVLSAPLKRARQTAETIAAGGAIEMAGWLTEIDHGPDEDQPEPAVIARVGTAAVADWDRVGIAPPGWVVDQPMRIAAWQVLLHDAARYEDIAVVTSNGAARFALLADAGLAIDASVLADRKLRTGAFGSLVRAPTKGWRIATWNQRP